MNIYQRINKVREEVEYIKKDAFVQGYRAVSHDMVTAKLRDSLIKQGIVIQTDQLSSNITEVGQTKSGTPIIRYSGWYDISYINIDEPEDRTTVRIEAHAMDHGDKAPGKCCSYAVKSSMLKMFNLETGENDESRVEDDRRGYTDAQKQGFDDLVAANDSLGLYLMSQEVDESVSVGLFNSGMKGKKVELKNKCRELESQGEEMCKNLEEGLRTGDSALIQENTHGLTHIGNSLLRRYLGRESFAELEQLKED